MNECTNQMLQPRREKNWPELTDAEKIERMRDQVRLLKRIVDAHDRGVSALTNHSHGPTGELLVPLNSHRNTCEANYRRGEDWF